MTESADQTRTLLTDALSQSPADERQVTFGGGRLHVLRVAGNRIQETVEERWSVLRLQLAFPWRGGWRVGRSQTTDTSSESLAQLAERARSQAMDMSPTSDYEPIPDLWDFESLPSDTSGAYDARTALAGPARLANELAHVTLPCMALDYAVRGQLAISVGTLEADGEAGLAAVANANDVFQFYLPTWARLAATITTPAGGTAYLEADGHGLGELDLAARAEQAIRRAELARLADPPASGPWRVLLEPPAMAALLDCLAPHFGYGRVGRGLSGLAELQGQAAFAPAFTLEASPTDPRLLGRPFDFEGWPSRTIRLVDGGVPSAWVYTRPEARAAGASPSGYARPGLGGALEAIPESLVMGGGEAGPDEMLKAGDHCLHFHHFHQIAAAREGSLELLGRASDEVVLVQGGRPVGILPGFAFRLDLGQLLASLEVLSPSVRARGHLVPAIVAGNGMEVL